MTILTAPTLTSAITDVVSAVTSFMPLLMDEPVIYFVAAGLVSVGAAIIAKFVPVGRGGRRK